jgi:hypothetical protein
MSISDLVNSRPRRYVRISNAYTSSNTVVSLPVLYVLVINRQDPLAMSNMSGTPYNVLLYLIVYFEGYTGATTI